MVTIGVDATYSVDPEPSGIAVYSRRLIESLAVLPSAYRFFICYRLSRFGQRAKFLRSENSRAASRFSVRFFQEPLTFWLPWQVEVFHSLAQRPPAFHFRREVVTIIDLFPLTGREYSTPDFQRKFSRLLLEAADRASLIITPSQYTTDELLKRTSVPGEKIRLIPFGVDLPDRTNGAEQRLRERERLVGPRNEVILSV